MWEVWIKYAAQIGYLPSHFWDFTPVEWALLLSAAKEKQDVERQQFGTRSWFTGLSSNIDRKKIKYQRWMNQFIPKQVQDECRTADIARTKNLLENINKKLKK